MKDRVHTFTFERSEEAIERIKNRVIQCREWMKDNLFNESVIKSIEDALNVRNNIKYLDKCKDKNESI